MKKILHHVSFLVFTLRWASKMPGCTNKEGDIAEDVVILLVSCSNNKGLKKISV